MRNLEMIRRLRRLSLRLERGRRAGSAIFRSWDRFTGPAEPEGVRRRGAIRDYLFVLSEVRNRATFRLRQISPRREVQLLVDLTDGMTPRLHQTACLLGGLILGLSDVRLTLSYLGTRVDKAQVFCSFEEWVAMDRLLTAGGRLALVPTSPGKLRQAVSGVEGHAMIVTSYLPPVWLSGVRPPLGCTLVVVDPPDGTVGLSDPVLVGAPDLVAQDRIEERYEELRSCCDARRWSMIRIRRDIPVIEALELALA